MTSDFNLCEISMFRTNQHQQISMVSCEPYTLGQSCQTRRQTVTKRPKKARQTRKETQRWCLTRAAASFSLSIERCCLFKISMQLDLTLGRVQLVQDSLKIHKVVPSHFEHQKLIHLQKELQTGYSHSTHGKILTEFLNYFSHASPLFFLLCCC